VEHGTSAQHSKRQDAPDIERLKKQVAELQAEKSQ
jgi:hypothetical protein